VLVPDAGAKYSNLGFALLGEVVARLSGRPFEQYIDKAIFRPLDMTSSSFTPGEALQARMATGYSPHPFEDHAAPSGHTPANGIAAAAGLYTTVTDLAKWIALQLRAASPAVGAASSPTEDESGESPAPDQILRPRSLDEMHTPQSIDANWTEARCLGWMGVRRGENVYLGHGGSMHGFITQIRFHKATGTGVIVLTNQGRHDVAGLASLDMMELLLPAVRAQQAASRERLPTPTPQDYRRFLGRYQLWGGAVTHVEFRDAGLRLMPAPPDQAALHAPARLAPTADPLVFRVTQGRAAGELAEFEAEEDGSIRGFTLSGFSYKKLG
jgi:CubicO group peptidase (beta-lactamase class C family)